MQKNKKNHAKSCFSVTKLISTSELRAEHPFAGRNTQQSVKGDHSLTVLGKVSKVFPFKVIVLPLLSFG